MASRTLSAHVGYLFTELPFEARIEAAAKAGFQAVEHPSPFELPAERLRSLLDDHGLGFAQISSGAGNVDAGEKGLAALDGRQEEFREGFARALDYAEELETPFVHAMAGIPSEPGAIADTVYRQNIEHAVRLCEARRPRLLLEVFSQATVPGYYLHDPKQLFNIIIELDGAPAALLDSYHLAVIGVDPARMIRSFGTFLGHVHVADYPGRHEPGTGSLDFASIEEALLAISYRGAIGFEYIPSKKQNFDWMTDW